MKNILKSYPVQMYLKLSRRRFLVQRVKRFGMRLPLVISEEDIDMACHVLEESFNALRRGDIRQKIDF